MEKVTLKKIYNVLAKKNRQQVRGFYVGFGIESLNDLPQSKWGKALETAYSYDDADNWGH